MKLTLNGRLHECAASTLLDLLIEIGIDPGQQGIAAAVNDEVVPRALWPERVLHDGDAVEAITAMQGG